MENKNYPRIEKDEELGFHIRTGPTSYHQKDNQNIKFWKRSASAEKALVSLNERIKYIKSRM